MNQQLKGAFGGCQWCGGRGCLQCDAQRQAAIERRQQPIFVADRNDPADMDALKRVFHRKSIEHAFGPEGGGMQEIEFNAAVESLLQSLRKSRDQADPDP